MSSVCTLSKPRENKEAEVAWGGFITGYVTTLNSKDQDIDGVKSPIRSAEAEFNELANQWHDETDYLSSPSRITSTDTHLKIISMGERVIPFILEDLKERGGNWYRALRILSGENPVPVEARGDVERMKDAWLRWGRQKGYLQ